MLSTYLELHMSCDSPGIPSEADRSLIIASIFLPPCKKPGYMVLVFNVWFKLFPNYGVQHFFASQSPGFKNSGS